MSDFLVVVRPDADAATVSAALIALGATVQRFSHLRRILRVSGLSQQAIESVADVETAEPEGLRVHATQDISIDAGFNGGSWAIARSIRRRAPWSTRHLRFPQTVTYQCARDGTGVDYYALDSGVRTTHSEFTGRATLVYEFYSSGGVGDDQGHGSGTTSCGCGATVGFARGALIWSFKCLDHTNSGTNTSVISAVNEVLSHYAGRSGLNRPAVVNMSMGGFTSAINTSIASMIDVGLVVVATAGNDKADLAVVTQLPAESDADVIVVGGSGPADIPYYGSQSGSNYGTRVDVVAPSQVAWMANNTGDSDYRQNLGTSFGCGYVSGVVCCMLQGHNRLTTRAEVQAVRAHVMSQATTGKFTSAFGLTLPDRLLYLNPLTAAPEAISGL